MLRLRTGSPSARALSAPFHPVLPTTPPPISSPASVDRAFLRSCLPHRQRCGSIHIAIIRSTLEVPQNGALHTACPGYYLHDEFQLHEFSLATHSASPAEFSNAPFTSHKSRTTTHPSRPRQLQNHPAALSRLHRGQLTIPLINQRTR